MSKAARTALNPRRKPRQARSEATVGVIFEATIQVLLAVGVAGLTTNRVATRAGVSIGSMYQYYPNKHALLFAIIERHLDEVVRRVEACSRDHLGEDAASAATAFVSTYVATKSANAQASRALYAASNGPEVADLSRRTLERIVAAVKRLLDASPDRVHLDNAETAFTLTAIATGATRVFVEQGGEGADFARFEGNLVGLVRGYLGG